MTKRPLWLAAGVAVVVMAVAAGTVWQARAATPQLGLQLGDHTCRGGAQRFTTGGWSASWVKDVNGFDPDCAQVSFSGFDPKLDFRVGIKAADGPSCTQTGPARFTPWASEGGGWSGWATDANAFDPDCASISIETQNMPPGVLVHDARVGVQLSDYACTAQVGTTKFTPWASDGGGWSGWTKDANGFDQDCYSLRLEVESERAGNVSVFVEASDGSALEASWTLKGPDGFTRSASKKYFATYENVPFGAYTISNVPQRIVTSDNKVFKLIDALPSSSQNLGPVSPPGCPAGESSPHLGCSDNACVQVTGCGPSNCNLCFEGKDPGTIDQKINLRTFFKDLLPRALARFACDPEGGCYDDGSGTSGGTCDSNSDCGGSDQPPPQPPPPAPAPKPTAITFTLKYQEEAPLAVECSPAIHATVRAGDPVSFNVAQGNGPFTWSVSEGGATRVIGSGSTLNTAFATEGVKRITLSNGSSSDICEVSVMPQVSNARIVVISKDNLGADFPTLWRITGRSSWTQTQLASSKTYSGVPTGTYGIEPIPVEGYVYSVTPALFQTVLTTEDTKTFAIVYTPTGDSVDPGGGPTGDPTLYCRPINQRADKDEVSRLTAQGGNGTYSWSAAGARPSATGSGTEFRVSYPSSGTKRIYLTSGQQTKTCTVQVRSCPEAAMLTVTPPQASVVVGATAAYTALYDADGPDCNPTQNPQDVTQSATWRAAQASLATLASPGNFRGVARGTTDISATYQGITASASLDVRAPKDFQCLVSPDHIVLVQGETKEGVVRCSPQGGFTGPISISDAAGNGLTMTFTPPTVSIPPDPVDTKYEITASMTAVPGTYTFDVTGTSAEGSHSYPVVVEVQSAPETLSVTLAPDPSSGIAPLLTTLTAQVTGATGPINYSFWWDCAYAGTSPLEAAAQCGTIQNGVANDSGIAFAGESATLKSAIYTYRNSRTHTPIVIVSRNGMFARAATSVVVGSPQTHAECVNSTCQQVAGVGPNRCQSNSDCGGGGCTGPNCDGGGEIHGECNPVAKVCVNRAGPGPSCSSDACAGGTTDSHLECQNNTCVIVSGPGINGTCATVGDSCDDSPLPPPDGGCSVFSASPKIIRQGAASTIRWQCQDVSNCRVTAAGRTTPVGSGLAGQATVSPAMTTQYSLTCTGLADPMSLSIYVLQNYDETNPGG